MIEGFDGSAVRPGPNHTTIEVWYDTEAQARAAHEAIRNLIYAQSPPADQPIHAVEGWHAPGLGEVHNADHTIMIDVMVDNPVVGTNPEFEPDYLPSDVIAEKLAALLNANPGVLTYEPPKAVTVGKVIPHPDTQDAERYRWMKQFKVELRHMHNDKIAMISDGEVLDELVDLAIKRYAAAKAVAESAAATVCK